jgi:hypothetical protein
MTSLVGSYSAENRLNTTLDGTRGGETVLELELGLADDQTSMASRISSTRGVSQASVQGCCTSRVGRRGGGLSHAKDSYGSRWRCDRCCTEWQSDRRGDVRQQRARNQDLKKRSFQRRVTKTRGITYLTYYKNRDSRQWQINGDDHIYDND